MDDSQNEAQLMSAGSDHGTFVLLKSHQRHTSQALFRENHPQTGKLPPPNAVVSTICSCRNAVFLCLQTRMRPSTGFSIKRLSSDQCTICHDLIFHLIWSRVHWNLTALWRILSSGRFIGLLARNLALLRHLLTVRLLIRPLTIYRLRSVFSVLNGCCLVSLVRSLSYLGVVFIDIPVLYRSFTLPVWFMRCFNRTMTEWLTLNCSAMCLYDIQLLIIPTACHLSASDSFQRAMLK